MAYNISDEILEQSSCQKQFSCLNEENYNQGTICEIQDADGLNVLFIKTNEWNDCKHRLSFGYSQICNCPARYAIYKKYLA